MKTKLIYPVVMVVLATACGGRDGARAGDQQQFESVQEGSAAGVTSTIHGPGETLPPLTGTNADTTTAFTLNPAAVGALPQQPAPPMGGTLPSSDPYGGAAAPPMYSASRGTTASPAPAPRPSAPRQQAQQQASPAPTQPQEAQPSEPSTNTATAEQTDTAVTPPAPPTNTAPPPSEATKPQEEKPKADEPQEQQDQEQAEEPPPPPPPTR
jgi:hypothetical protein